MVKQTIWPPNHTSHRKNYFNESVANALRGNIAHWLATVMTPLRNIVSWMLSKDL